MAFKFDPDRIARLVEQMHPAFANVRAELLIFTDFLRQVGGN